MSAAELWELPEGWAWAQFQEVAHVASNLVSPSGFQNHPHIAPNHIESGTGQLLEYTTIANDKVASPKHRFYPGQILYSKIRPYLCKAVVVDFEGLCSADMYPIASGIDTAYLHRWMVTKTFTELASHHDTRTVLPKINQEALAVLSVPVPPQAEQRRIVAAVEAVLAKVNAARDRLNRVPAILKRFRQAVLSAACSGRLTADWREKTSQSDAPEPQPAVTAAFDESTPFEIPDLWQWAELGRVASVERGKFTVRPRNDPRYYGGRHPFVQIGDLPPDGGPIRTFHRP
jgi:type I restriction enzyme S subunit